MLWRWSICWSHFCVNIHVLLCIFNLFSHMKAVGCCDQTRIPLARQVLKCYVHWCNRHSNYSGLGWSHWLDIIFTFIVWLYVPVLVGFITVAHEGFIKISTCASKKHIICDAQCWVLEMFTNVECLQHQWHWFQWLFLQTIFLNFLWVTHIYGMWSLALLHSKLLSCV